MLFDASKEGKKCECFFDWLIASDVLVLFCIYRITGNVCYIVLSHKLRCYIRISGPKKGRNKTREKISYFFTCVDIANQLLTRHSPLAPLGQVDE